MRVVQVTVMTESAITFSFPVHCKPITIELKNENAVLWKVHFDANTPRAQKMVIRKAVSLLYDEKSEKYHFLSHQIV